VGTVVLDASLIIAFLYPADAHHRVARQVLAPWLAPEHTVLVPASVYSEILVGPIRTRADDIVERFLSATESRIVAIDRAIARRAAVLRATRSGLRLPDALALATALEHDAAFLTFDTRLQRIAEGLAE
jgi:predicted nucleic acid-binding protein